MGVTSVHNYMNLFRCKEKERQSSSLPENLAGGTGMGTAMAGRAPSIPILLTGVDSAKISIKAARALSLS